MPTVADIIVDRLLEKIQSENILPWNKPFTSGCMNWFSHREYQGINKILLDGYEYITVNQLKAYNNKNNTSFWFDAGTPSDIVVFYTNTQSHLSAEKANELIKSGQGNYVKSTPEGWVRLSWTFRYYRVYDIRYIRDIINPELKEKASGVGVFKKNTLDLGKGKVSTTLELDSNGHPILLPHVNPEDLRWLESKIGTTVVERYTPADVIVDKYTANSGIEIQLAPERGAAYYNTKDDTVNLPEGRFFLSSESYYRTLFHELVHSTGVEKRLNRESLKKYKGRERSKEELIAEVGSLLLASEAGFREDTTWADNSLEYVAGWCSWMKEHPSLVLSGMLEAEKAKNYILSGCESTSSLLDRGINQDDTAELDLSL